MNKKIKNIYLLFIITILIMIPKDVKALTASLNCSSKSSVTLGNTITVTISGNASTISYWEGTLDYDSSKLQLISGDVRPFTDSATSNLNFTYTFKTINTGSAYVKMSNMNISDELAQENPISISSSTCNINVVKASSSSSGQSHNVTKSSDNNLKSLSIDNTTLSPEFNKDNLEYSVELESDITKIKVNAETNDSKASVSGIGEIDVKEGQNKIEVVVTAENGSTKTYIINAYVKEKDPIKVKSSGNNYTVVRNLDGITIPDNFEEVDVRIDDEIVKGFYNKVSNITLVALKDKKGNISLFIYDLNKFTYTKYNSITSSNANIIIIKPDKNIKIPHKYYEVNFEYNGETIKGYTLGENSQFRIIYGIDSQTGEKTFYQYDLVNNTIQRFYNEQVEIYVNLIKKCKFVFLILGISIIVLIIIIIILLSRNIKFKNNYLNSELISNPRKNNKSQNDSDVELKDSNKRKKEKTFLDE